jgi:hypothetical protein
MSTQTLYEQDVCKTSHNKARTQSRIRHLGCKHSHSRAQGKSLRFIGSHYDKRRKHAPKRFQAGYTEFEPSEKDGGRGSSSAVLDYFHSLIRVNRSSGRPSVDCPGPCTGYPAQTGSNLRDADQRQLLAHCRWLTRSNSAFDRRLSKSNGIMPPGLLLGNTFVPSVPTAHWLPAGLESRSRCACSERHQLPRPLQIFLLDSWPSDLD